jgi:hypothetical protein
MTYLDRILVNQAWLLIFRNTSTFSFPHIISNHSLICLDNRTSHIFQASQFRFEALIKRDSRI